MITNNLRCISYGPNGHNYLLLQVSMQTHAYILIRSNKKAAMYVSLHQAGFTHTLLAKHDHLSVHSHGSHDYFGLQKKTLKKQKNKTWVHCVDIIHCKYVQDIHCEK